MAIFKFGFFSLLGLLAFLAPITIGGNSSILMGHFKGFIIDNYSNLVDYLIILSSVVTIVGTTIGFIKKDFKNKYLNDLFVTDLIGSILRIGGGIIFITVHINVAPAAFVNPNTGGLMAGDLIPSLMTTFFVGVLLMPLLTSFGLVEFIGTLIAPVMRKVFRVPGYAAIDALASFLGDGTIGVVVTDEQYQKGYYTKREAAVIATSFSIVGISFAAVVADMLGFADRFWVFYGTIALSTVIAGFVIARLPLKKFEDKYYSETIIEESKELSLSKAINLATDTAAKTSLLEIMLDALFKVLVIYITFIPVIMCVGTLGLVIAETTPFFTWITLPLVPVLKLFGFADAIARNMAPALVVGFADMYLPAIFIENTASEAARFVVGALSFAQLIFLSETGMILVNTKMGFNFLDLVKFFLLRTVIAFPVVFIVAKVLLGMGILVN